MPLRHAFLFGLVAAAVMPAGARQKPEVGGFLESGIRAYAARSGRSDARAVAEERFQVWARSSIGTRISWRGRMDFRLDTHHDTDRRHWFDLSQRRLQRPAGALSELYLDARLGRLDLRLGKQEIRWGRADGFNPTDNLIPYDYLDTFADERLPVPAAKADFYAGRGRLEAVWIPFYTPSRLPRFGRRWFPRLPGSASLSLPSGAAPALWELEYRDEGGRLPARTFSNGQWGARWNQTVPRVEFSISYFDGVDDIPYFRYRIDPIVGAGTRARVAFGREYHRVRVAGGDFASALGPFGLRGEMAWFDRRDPGNLDHLLFVLGLDRTWGDWFVILQYAGQKVCGGTPGPAVFPDLGLRSTLLGRAERTLSPGRSLEIKGALRLRDGDFLLQAAHSHALSNRWRLRLGANLFGGPSDGYLGQFRDSGHVFIELRFSY